jgi:hypothetical protein
LSLGGRRGGFLAISDGFGLDSELFFSLLIEDPVDVETPLLERHKRGGKDAS